MKSVPVHPVASPDSMPKDHGTRPSATIFSTRASSSSQVVGDRWQAQGVGAALLEQCLSIARERGIESIRGLILAENTTMIALGRRLGFSVDKIPGGKDYELRIELKDLKPKPE